VESQDEAMLRRRREATARMQRLPEGVSPVVVRRQCQEGHCHVCDEETEYDNNLLLTCDACRVHVHMDCYGVAAAPDGRLWLCDVCSLGATGAGRPFLKLEPVPVLPWGVGGGGLPRMR
jgi:PHD-finger